DRCARSLHMSEQAARAFSRLGVGVGVVIAHDHYPARRLMEYAHALERSAKRICGGEAHRSATCFVHMRSGDELVEGGPEVGFPIGMPRYAGGPAEWRRLTTTAGALARVPSSQRTQLRGELGRAEYDRDDPELRSWFRYQVARSAD